MKSFLFKQVKIVDSQSSWNGQEVDVLIRDGHIDAVGKDLQESADTVNEGGCLSPGWVDMRVRLTDPGYEWKDDLRSLSAAAAAGGFTRIVCLPNTKPVLDNRDAIQSLTSRSEQLPVHFHAYGALTHGAKGEDLAELYDMHQHGAVGFTNGLHALQGSGTVLRALQYLHSFGGLLVNYPYDESIGRDGIVNEGAVSTRLGLKGTPSIAEEVMLSRDLKLLEYFQHRMHVGPITTSGSIEVLKAARLRFPELSVETSAMYLYLTDESLEGFDPHYKVFPPLRTAQDRDALCEAVKAGVVDAISSFHWPEGTEEKMVEFPAANFGMGGLQTCFPLVNEALVKGGYISLTRLMDLLSHNPARILGLPTRTIEKGANAELTWLTQMWNGLYPQRTGSPVQKTLHFFIKTCLDTLRAYFPKTP